MTENKEICIIGCGIAGLSALRVFSEEIINFPHNYSLHAYEKTSNLGGLWNYNENINAKFMTPVYRDLKTNLPKELMACLDLEFSTKISDSFIGHKDVLEYIKNYAKYYDLEKYIEFNSEILHVEPVTFNSSTKWKIMIKSLKSGTIFEKWFDVVLICNGHFEKPKIPKIKDIENFKGEIIHSKYYRFPEKYANKNVFVIGARSSGLDIAHQLLKLSNKVYLSHSGPKQMWKTEKNNFVETLRISHIDLQGAVCITDGSKYDVDVIIFCTGYEMNLSFLSDKIGLKYDDAYVRPLYKHLINPYFPNNFFMIGLGYEITPFNHCYMQSKVARSIVQNCFNDLDLSFDSLMKNIEKDEEEFINNDIEMRHRHYFNTKQWPYFRWCTNVAKSILTNKIPYYLEKLFEIVKKWRFKNSAQYRDINIQLANNKLGFDIKNGPENDFYSEDIKSLLI